MVDMKKAIFLILLIFAAPINVIAQRGCCSHHGGVAGCSEYGRQICSDGTLSPSCTCTPTITYVYGCTDETAKNYNPSATKNDGSCKYYIYGCTDQSAKNYDSEAEKDDSSCEYYIYGCMDKTAKNYNGNAEKSDNSCIYYKYGCTDENAINYDYMAEKDDNSCEYKKDKLAEDIEGIASVLTLGGIGAGIYYFKKRKL